MITASTASLDQEKFLAARLIQRALLKLVCASVCDRVQQPEGTGTTANFVRYERMNVPLVPLTEGSDPSDNSFSLTTVTVTLDQWGDVLTLTDVALLTTKHPLLQQATELLADNAQRVIDREVQLVWLSGTNVQYGDNSVTTRLNITSGMKISDTIIHRARVTMVNNGAPPRGGPAPGGYLVEGAEGSKSINQGFAYVGICSPNVMADIMQAGTSLGTWASVAMYANQKSLYNAEIGTWLGIRWVETNFIPKFQLLGNATATVTSGAAFGTNTPTVTDNGGGATGGALKHASTFGFKITMKDLTRGFEEQISQSQGILTDSSGGAADTHSISFAFPANTGFVYNLYFDSVAAGSGNAAADSLLKLVQANIAAGTTVTVLAVQATGASPPSSVTSGVSVHPIYLHGAESCNWVGLQNLQVFVSLNQATTDNPILLRRKVGYKFMGKTMIRDQKRILRLEVASGY